MQCGGQETSYNYNGMTNCSLQVYSYKKFLLKKPKVRLITKVSAIAIPNVATLRWFVVDMKIPLKAHPFFLCSSYCKYHWSPSRCLIMASWKGRRSLLCSLCGLLVVSVVVGVHYIIQRAGGYQTRWIPFSRHLLPEFFDDTHSRF